jgi:hypothetical protein|tara:strand:+ start:1249 stop:1539 length:291 start_codon:yes stop_codon:yes gene_type:complete
MGDFLRHDPPAKWDAGIMHNDGFRSTARVILGIAFFSLWVIAGAVFAGLYEAVCQACLPSDLKAILFVFVGLAVAGSGGLLIWHRHRNLFADPHHP